jgi:uncharacterized protein YndB with AHSA1/START domain
MDGAPVVRTLPLRCPRPHAFAVFTARIGEWWPAGFTASGDNLANVVIEGRPGGRVYEADRGGSQDDWGSVTAWEPDRRIVLTWTLGQRAGPPTVVDVLFAGDGDRCDVRLEHGGWTADQAADRARFDDAGGWNVVLDAYRAHAEAGK